MDMITVLYALNRHNDAWRLWERKKDAIDVFDANGEWHTFHTEEEVNEWLENHTDLC